MSPRTEGSSTMPGTHPDLNLRADEPRRPGSSAGADPLGTPPWFVGLLREFVDKRVPAASRKYTVPLKEFGEALGAVLAEARGTMPLKKFQETLGAVLAEARGVHGL